MEANQLVADVHERATLLEQTPALANGLRRWIASGPCRSDSGAYYAWIDGETSTPAFEYPEITGYALTYLAALPDMTVKEAEAGRCAADWLLARLGTADLSARAGWDGQAIYNFDLAMIATGLMTFGRRHGIERYADVGRGLARGFAEQARALGTLPSIPPGSGPTARSAWSTEGEAHLVKVVQSLLLAAELGEPETLDCAHAIIDGVACIQQPDGRIVTHPRDEETMLHPHLYAVEGLWAFGCATGDEAALERARLGIGWAWQQAYPSGALPRYVATATGERGPEQFDLTSQAIRMALVLEAPLDVEPALRRLEEVAVERLDGTALPYQPEPAAQHLNTWVSLFAAQAVALADPAAAPLHWTELV